MVEDWWKFKVAKMRKEEGHPVLKNDIFVTRLVLRSAEIQPLIPRFVRFSLFDLNRLEFKSAPPITNNPKNTITTLCYITITQTTTYCYTSV